MSYNKGKSFEVKCYTCSEMITFDPKYVSDTGKKIPLWTDKQNTHGHDDNGNPTRGQLPTLKQPSHQPQYNAYEDNRQKSPPSGQSTLTTNYEDIKTELRRQDAKIEGIYSKINHVVEIAEALLAKQSFVPATQLHNNKEEEEKGQETTNESSEMVNHSRIADENMSQRQQQQQTQAND